MKLGILAATLAFSAFFAEGFRETAAGNLTPDRGEIESAKSSSVIFVDYEGPEPRINSLADIKGLERRSAAR